MFYYQVDDHIQLRVMENKNARELYKLIDNNRLYLREWLPWVGATTSVDAIKDFIRSSRKQLADNNGFQAGIYYKGEIAGSIGLHGIDWSNKKTTIGYWLAEEYQGKGIMTESCRAIINHVIKDLGLNRVEIRAAEFNKKSRAVPERLGFTLEGSVRQAEWLYDHYVNHAVYGILAEEWNKTH
ncbi:GNAT family N-acetyltransferase [Ruminiclostridium cellobioparum]|jgi:ribosomal-protein-serine acetyltransferase|uniref:GNAT family N-acetyltransferase n=1 Tax=Ruminiclostridium cellobioparum TaxID=29355 RepID=UPI0004833067|nr:GNAT family protein [Ruminiclostridium cellobioparum]